MSIIGIRKLNKKCVICCVLSSSERVLNELTMDLILGRLNCGEIVEKYEDLFLSESLKLSESLVKQHESHCEKKAVPDDYVFHPDLYEDGETLGRDIHRKPSIRTWPEGEDFFKSIIENSRRALKDLSGPGKEDGPGGPSEPGKENPGKP